MDKIIIEINPIANTVEASLEGNSKLASDVMYEVCEALINMNNAEHISTELDIRK